MGDNKERKEANQSNVGKTWQIEMKEDANEEFGRERQLLRVDILFYMLGTVNSTFLVLKRE